MGNTTYTPKQLYELATLSPEMENTAIRGILAENLDKDFVQRIMSYNPNVSNASRNMDGSHSTHLMASGDTYAYPTIAQKDGNFHRNTPATGEAIDMGNGTAAWWLGKNYKRANPGGFGI